ncbi:30S ribosomal protein S4 [Crocinitomicaceae bacterium CZZ-1]|uniref:Small ribosomal subunit protein uS4 n=1 Tax=Taishania pollutisoli TaxID=2766479 RepID=A0A8J6PHF9_9FLAO|nr:30S ribosomal protein S4 [Taishania pollutisoli]MBC9811631.1 30S ribosomal protein S4 [Taishania pollutisoli]MBX2948434.1 30S ribosomal protein S4 [Crocinitomicaceae bacterium]NGF75532.1 30S ribosomal protein S4 [Fluviicola sp. SGL-29]
MARYTGPKSKIARRFRDPIFGPDKALERRAYGPGQHGPNKRRGGKQSEYAIQLGEKQKAKYTYGILERQFSNMYKKANAKPGITGEILLQLCEMRLDNTVYRFGVAPSRRAARQLVTHKHITVNGEIVNVPSYQLKPGDVVGVREKSKSLETITGTLSSNGKKYDWLAWDNATMTGTLLAVPAREMIPENIKEQLIVELYSK